ncbi:MAG: cell surface protein SprA [Candidatus Zixiibacteriota bacterium]
MSVRSHTKAVLILVALLLRGGLSYAQVEGIGFQARLEMRSMVVSPYEAPDDRFSAALYPLTYPVLSGQLLYVPKAEEKSDFDAGAISFGTRMHGGVDLVPVSVDARRFYERRTAYNISERWEGFALNSLVQSQRQGKRDGLSIGVNLPKRFDQMFGEGGANLRVSGYRRISFSGRSQWDDAAGSGIRRQSKFPALNMEQISRFTIQGTIGTKITVSVSQDNQTDIPLANRLILRYKGDEDDILKTIEAGNTTLNIPNTRFVGYSQSIAGLFGIKTEARLGNFGLTAIASQEKGSSESATVSATGEENAEPVRDYQYQEGRIFDLAYPGEIGRYDSVRVFVYEEETDQRNPVAEKMYLENGPLDPNGTYNTSDQLMSEVQQDQFELLYGQDTTRCPVALVFYNGRRRAIGVRMFIQRFSSPGNPTGVIDTIGYTDPAETDTLRIIQPLSKNIVPDNPAWNLMWRNCYRIPKNVKIEDIDIRVFKGLPGREGTSSSLDYQKVDDVAEDPYIQILGLDQWNNNRTDTKIPDGKIDPFADVFREDWGLIIFPEREPFNSNRVFVDATGNRSDTLVEKVSSIYRYASPKEKTDNSKYYLWLSTKARSASIRLGRANVIEGSERVTLNGRPLVKGKDYEISYDLGQVTLLTDEATDPNSDVRVEFQYAPFMALQKKTLLGMRAEYEHSENLKLGTTVLYKSDKAQERKPRVGQETSKASVYDFDMSFALNPKFITKAVDALPFIDAEADSRIRVTAEVAQSRPNPNVDGAAYVDDFESAVELLSLGNVRTNWTLASAPVDVDTSSDAWARGTIRWHNPPAISREEVYEGETVAGQGALQPLRLIFRPRGYKFFGPSETPCADSMPSKSWGGIMRSFENRVDRKRVQLFEVRAKGGKGKLHFDFGRISEDINGNGKNEDEDWFPENRSLDVIPGSGINEDTGLDSLLDPAEIDACGRPYDVAINPDPAADNWWYEYKGKGAGGGTSRPPVPLSVWNLPGYQDAVNTIGHWLHYEWQNGTEGNIDDDAVQGLPDREVLGSGFEENNAYFTFELDLDTINGKHVVAGSGRNGWHTFRVPVRDPGVLDTVSDGQTTASWEGVTHVRVWFEQDTTGVDSLASMDSIWIADWGFVQSNWTDTLMTLTGDATSKFFVASVSEENGTFTPPPGVKPYVDQVNNVTETQRGLAMVFQDLLPGAEGITRKDLLTTESYSGYRRMEMYVHGDNSLDPSDSVMLYFRLGHDSANYYEFRTYVEAGWSPRNHVRIDFNEITALKDAADRALPNKRSPLEDSTDVYRVVGRPNINEIRYITTSVMNHKADSTAKVSGEIWLDELRVTEVRKDVGTAARVTVNGSLSDLISYTTSYEHRDAYFRGLAQATRGGSRNNLGSGEEVNDFNFSATFNVSRFLPRSWGARVPVSYSYAQSESVPLLRSSSDVVLPPEIRELEKSTSRSVKLSFSESFARKGGNLLFNAFLNRQKFTASYTRSRQKRINNPLLFNENYNFRADFDMGVAKPPEVPIFFWTKSIPILKKTRGSKLALYPRKWLWNGAFNRNLSAKDDVDFNRTSSLSRTMDGRMDFGFQVFPNLSVDYNFSTRRDLTDPKLVVIRFRNPKLGLENSYSQGFRTNYDPKLLNFFTSTLTYSSNYSDNYDASTRTRSTSLTSSWSVTGEFKHMTLFGSGRRSAPTSRPETQRPQVRGEVVEEVEKETPKKPPGKPFYEPVLKGLRFLTGWLQPLRYSHSEGFNRSIPGVAGRLPWRYRLGFDKMAEFPILGTRRNPSAGQSNNWDLSSGFTFLGGISTTVGYKRSSTEALTTVGTDRTRSVTVSWPELNLQVRRFTKLPLVKKYVNWFIEVFSPRTAFSRQVKTSENLDHGFITSRSESINRSPLLSLNLKLFKKLSVSSSYGVNRTVEEKFNNSTGAPESETHTTKKTVGVTTKFAFSAPGGISIPLLGKVKFKSLVSIDMSVQYSSNLVETSRRGGKFVPFTNTSSFSASPVISYTFSNQIRGGLTARWQDTNDVQRHRKSHVREIQLWTEIHF